MPSISSQGARIRTNIQGELALDSLSQASFQVSRSQLRLTTGKRINQAADDVSGYITSKSLNNRYTSLNTAMIAVEEARSITSIVSDSLDNVFGLVESIRSSAVLASSESTGTSEKVALAKASFRMAQQIDLVQNSTVYSGQQLLHGEFRSDWVVGFDANNGVKSLEFDLQSTNLDFNVESNNFTLDISTSTRTESAIFGGVTGLDLSSLNDVTSDNLGIFEDSVIGDFVRNLSEALSNISNVNAYVGGIGRRLEAQQEAIFAQNVNYKAAISRLEDSDVAEEQLNLVKNQFLTQTSLLSVSQSNLNVLNYFRVLN